MLFSEYKLLSNPSLDHQLVTIRHSVNNSSRYSTATSIMFKSLVLVACFACIGSVLTAYTTKYDNVDLDEILANDRLFSNYYKCLLDQGNCSPDGAELKSKYQL